MFNDFRGYDENFNEVFISIPPTLLVSSIGVVDDVRACQTIDFKCAGDLVYVAGMTDDETGGSEYLACMGEKLSGRRYIGDAAPGVSAEDNIRTYRALENALAKGLVASSASVERGGLGLALAKSALAGMLGVAVDCSKVPSRTQRNDAILFSESQGRVLLSVNPARRAEFEHVFSGVPLGLLGSVTADAAVTVTGTKGNTIVRTDIDSLMKSYRGVFKDF